jgi:uncharacterized protein YoxC
MEVGKKSILKLKILFKKYLTKLGFGKEFDYGDYKKRRNLVFVGAAIIFIIVAIVAFVVGGQYTTEALKNQVKELQTTLQGNNLEIGRLNSELGNKTAESIQKDKTILQCSNDLNHSATSLNECHNETTQLKSQLEDEKNKYEQLFGNLTTCNSQKQALMDIVKSSVRATCCSFGAIQQGLQVSWDISGNQIICGGNGNYIVNCGTGTTNYPS